MRGRFVVDWIDSVSATNNRSECWREIRMMNPESEVVRGRI
jgi:hypothetical protein